MQFEKAKSYILDRLQRELPEHLSYHSIWHTKDVYNSAEVLAAAEHISDADLNLLLTACLFHDCGFLQQQKNHEQISCEIARNTLPDFEYTSDEIEKICGMIQATKIPQEPHNLLEQIICDADLDYLGRDDFFSIGNKLYEELMVYGYISNDKEWDELQIRFLESHHYFTQTANSKRKAQKEAYLTFIKARYDNKD